MPSRCQLTLWPLAVDVDRYDGFTEEQIKAVDPTFSDERRGDKLGMRYPKGESYLDLVTRLEPLVRAQVARGAAPPR